jgi:hypothetical protein
MRLSHRQTRNRVGLLLFMHRHHALSHLEDTTDGADVGPQQPMFNLSNVRPTGIGGLLLSMMAVWVASRYPQGRALLLMGMLGGSVVGAALIKMHSPQRQFARPLQLPGLSNSRRNDRS